MITSFVARPHPMEVNDDMVSFDSDGYLKWEQYFGGPNESLMAKETKDKGFINWKL